MANALSSPFWDKVFMGWMVFSLYFALFMDCLNFIAPAGKIDAAVLDTLPWPPRFMRDVFAWWTSPEGGGDIVLRDNAAWYRVICGYSPFIHAPFYVFALWCWVKRNPVVRNVGLIWAGWMVGALIPVFAESLGVDGSQSPSPKPLVFAAAYGSFILMPILMVVRLWGPEPFPALKGTAAAGGKTKTKSK